MISFIRLIDIQSFKDVTFNFSDGVNVFQAPNETGKSVIFKVFRIMNNANWYGRGERDSIIRRGAEKGVALIVVPYSGGNFKIMFEVYKTYQIYRLYDGDKHMNSWKQDTLPEDIRDILGWYYDNDSKILLNLCDQELDMPFVNSNLGFNYEVMRFIIQNPELERARMNIANWLASLKEHIETLSYKHSKLSGAISQYEIVDTVELEDSISKREDCLNKATALCNLLETLNKIVELEKPEFNSIDTKEVERVINISSSLREVGIALQSALKEDKPTLKYVDVVEVEKLINVCKTLNQMKFNLYNASNAISDKKVVEMKLQNTKELIEDFEKEHSVCPLCGQAFNS